MDTHATPPSADDRERQQRIERMNRQVREADERLSQHRATPAHGIFDLRRHSEDNAPSADDQIKRYNFWPQESGEWVKAEDVDALQVELTRLRAELKAASFCEAHQPPHMTCACCEAVHADDERKQAEAEVARLRADLEISKAETMRAVLRYTAKGYAAGENAPSKYWRERAETAEASYTGLLVDLRAIKKHGILAEHIRVPFSGETGVVYVIRADELEARLSSEPHQGRFKTMKDPDLFADVVKGAMERGTDVPKIIADVLRANVKRPMFPPNRCQSESRFSATEWTRCDLQRGHPGLHHSADRMVNWDEDGVQRPCSSHD